MQESDFQEITVEFLNIEGDPDHHEKLLYSFALSPTPNQDWKTLFSNQIWPERTQFSPSWEMYFIAPERIVVRCFKYDEETGVVGKANEAVDWTNRKCKELLQKLTSEHSRQTMEELRSEAERDRLIREKVDKLKQR